MPSGHHRVIYDAFVVSSGPQTSMKQEDVVLQPQTSSAPAPSSSHSVPQPQMTRSSSLSIPSVSTQPIESDPQSVFFAPPNTMPLPHEETDSIPNIFGNRPLVKPAGDVSLPGPQLVAFLYKATARLPPAKCEGVRLKLQQLKDFVDEGRLSEPCLQKLNYLVDAIDRNLFVDALMYFEQLQAQFPTELGHWIQGLRLLLHELRGTTRIGSAGAYIRNQ